ncbi:MAG: hypothetical protein JW936_08715 [Sedimentisphaerales bacterium]|nr:hypothetical protein [Sedimentisphaerales bacterium]
MLKSASYRYRMVICAMVMAVCGILVVSAQGATQNISFVPGDEIESTYLFENDSQLVGSVRHLNSADSYVIYRLDTAGLTDVELNINLSNSFALSASYDGQGYVELASDVASGDSNAMWRRFNLNEFMSFRYVFVKITNAAVEDFEDAMGANILGVEFETTGLPDTPLAQMARITEPIVIDGSLDEIAWQNAQRLSSFSERVLLRSQGRSTTFRFCYDSEHFYVAVECEMPGADQTSPAAVDHDSNVYAGESVEVFLVSPNTDIYYHLVANQIGTIFDERRAEGGPSYDSHAETVAIRTSQGWILEAAIPIDQMDNEPMLEDGQVWGLSLNRTVLELARLLSWSCLDGAGFHDLERFGTIELVGVVDGALPAVNIDFVNDPIIGDNQVLVSWPAGIDRDNYELELTIQQAKSRYILESHQASETMRPRMTILDWPEDENADSMIVDYRLDNADMYHLLASLRDKNTGVTVSRAMVGRIVTEQNVSPMEVTMQQPNVSTESVLPIDIKLNIAPEDIATAQLFVTLKDDADNTIISQGPIAAQQDIEVVLNVADLALGDYNVTFELTDNNCQQIALVDRELHKYQAEGTARSVTIDDNGVCYVDGEAILPLGFYLGGVTPEAVEAGYILAIEGTENNLERGIAACRSAAENGGYVLLHICNYLRGNNDFDGIRDAVSRIKNEPGLLAWYLSDEPESHGETPQFLSQAYEIIRTIDPCHPVMNTTNVPDMLQNYHLCSDIISPDPYPVPNSSLAMVPNWTDKAVQAAQAHGLASWNTLQAFGYYEFAGAPGRYPTDSEFWTMMLTSFSHGSKGVMWWPYSIARNNHWNCISEIGRRAVAMKPWILFGTDVPGMPAGVQVEGDLHWRAFLYENQVLVMISNVSYDSPAYASIPLPAGVTSCREMFVENPQRQLQHGEAEININLAPTQSRVITFSLR